MTWTEIPLTYAQATLGDEITVPTVDGKVKYTVPEGTQTGTVFRLRGKGIKKVNRNDHGDHYVRVTVEVPRNLTKEQKEKLRDYEKSSVKRTTQSAKHSLTSSKTNSNNKRRTAQSCSPLFAIKNAAGRPTAIIILSSHTCVLFDSRKGLRTDNVFHTASVLYCNFIVNTKLYEPL